MTDKTIRLRFVSEIPGVKPAVAGFRPEDAATGEFLQDEGWDPDSGVRHGCDHECGCDRDCNSGWTTYYVDGPRARDMARTLREAGHDVRFCYPGGASLPYPSVAPDEECEPVVGGNLGEAMRRMDRHTGDSAPNPFTPTNAREFRRKLLKALADAGTDKWAVDRFFCPDECDDAGMVAEAAAREFVAAWKLYRQTVPEQARLQSVMDNARNRLRAALRAADKAGHAVVMPFDVDGVTVGQRSPWSMPDVLSPNGDAPETFASVAVGARFILSGSSFRSVWRKDNDRQAEGLSGTLFNISPFTPVRTVPGPVVEPAPGPITFGSLAVNSRFRLVDSPHGSEWLKWDSRHAVGSYGFRTYYSDDVEVIPIPPVALRTVS